MSGVAAQPATLSRRMVRAARGLTYAGLAPAVIEKVKTGLLDMLSCAFEARTLPWGEQAICLAGRASNGGAAIIGTPWRAAAADAAFANAVLGHGLVREDMHTGAVSHLGVVIYPVLLALAQEKPVNGRDFIAAAVSGYEVGAAVGRAIMDQEMVRRFRPTGITGPLAGAVAGSRILGLSEDASVSALGFAANTVGGLNEWPFSGGDEMFFHPGFAARNAVTATLLANFGGRASESALDGPAGLFSAFGKAEQIAAVAPFTGARPEILSVYYKPAPACNYAQTACQAALALAGSLEPSQIVSITVSVPAAAVNYPGCNSAGPFERILQAKMSIQYCVAATLRCGVIEEANYHLLNDPEILRLARIIKLESDTQFSAAYPQSQGAALVVSLRNGQTLRASLPDVNPATPPEIRERFRKAAGPKAMAIEERIENLENESNFEELNSLLGQP
ncbi:MAG: MmgE/PrpD family protein [Acidobacteriia bacterium]|nr:MmgE/PrpD family protein [Terriglobia bacterium]